MFENIDYNIADYPTIGYDVKFKDENTILLKERVIDFLIDGKSTGYLAKMLCKDLNFKAYGAKMFVNKCYKEMLNTSKKAKDNVVEKNFQRVTRVYEQAMEANDRKTALQAIDILNKMGGAYTQKVEVSTNEFEIKLNEE